MARYKVLVGAHAQDGKVYGPGQTDGLFFESDLDMVKKFGHEKFQLVSGSPKERMSSGEEGEGEDAAPGRVAGHKMAFPAGQVVEGKQESTSDKDGVTTSGPMSEESEGEGEEAPNGDTQKKRIGQTTKKIVLPHNIDRMSAADLKKFAKDNDVDLEGVEETRPAILKAIRSAHGTK